MKLDQLQHLVAIVEHGSISRAADRLGLAFEQRFTGYGGLAPLLEKAQQAGATH